MKRLILLALFACNLLLCMDAQDAQPQPDINVAISTLQKAEPVVNTFNSTILQEDVLVLLTRKKEYSTAISPIAFFRRKDGAYSRIQLPDDFSTKIVSGNADDEIEVIADGNKHRFAYNFAHRLMGFERLGSYAFLFQNPTIGTAITTNQPSLNQFFSLPETTKIPVQKLYPYCREINALHPTQHANIFRMPETSNTLLMTFEAELTNRAIVLPTTLVAVTPEGCLTLPFPTEKIKRVLALKEEDRTKDSLSHTLLNALARADDRSCRKIYMLTESHHQEHPHGLAPNEGTSRALIEELHATTLSLTQISLETLRRYKASLQETL